jgi:hypothetical protein
VKETFALPEPECYKSQVELLEQAEPLDPCCSIRLDLYIDHICRQLIKPETSAEGILRPTEKSLDIDTFIDKLITDKMTQLVSEMNEMKEEIATLTGYRREILKTVIFPRSGPILKVTVHHTDYVYNLSPVNTVTHKLNDSCELSNISPADIDRLAEQLEGHIKGSKVLKEKEIPKAVPWVDLPDKEFGDIKNADVMAMVRGVMKMCDFKDSVRHRNLLSTIGDMDNVNTENVDDIKYITHHKDPEQKKYNLLFNHEMDPLTKDFIWDQETRQHINVRNEALRYYLKLLHMNIACFKNRGVFAFFSDPRQLAEIKPKTFSTYEYSIDDQTIDTLIAKSTIDSKVTIHNKLLLKFMEEDQPPEPNQVTGDQLTTILRYFLYHELWYNYEKLKTNKESYCEFVRFFLKTITDHHKLNNTSANDVKILTILDHQPKPDAKPAQLDKEGKMLHNAFKFLGFNKNIETDELEAVKEAHVKETPGEGDFVGITTDATRIHGEIEPENEGPIDDE